MIPYCRPKLSDLYTLSQSKLLENHALHSSTYLYSPYLADPPPDPILYYIIDIGSWPLTAQEFLQLFKST